MHDELRCPGRSQDRPARARAIDVTPETGTGAEGGVDASMERCSADAMPVRWSARYDRRCRRADAHCDDCRAQRRRRALGQYLSSECVTCHQHRRADTHGIPPIVGCPRRIFVEIMGEYRAKKRSQSGHADDCGSAQRTRKSPRSRLFRKPAAGQLSNKQPREETMTDIESPQLHLLQAASLRSLARRLLAASGLGAGQAASWSSSAAARAAQRSRNTSPRIPTARSRSRWSSR